MELTTEELTTTLAEILGPHGDVELSRDTPDSRISGFIVHPEFRGLSLPERRARILPRLREALKERSQEVGTLFLYSPEEYESISAA